MQQEISQTACGADVPTFFFRYSEMILTSNRVDQQGDKIVNIIYFHKQLTIDRKISNDS